MILSHTPNCYACIGYGCLCKNKFQEKSREELKDDNYTRYSRGLSELHERALLVIKIVEIRLTIVCACVRFLPSKQMYKSRHDPL